MPLTAHVPSACFAGLPGRGVADVWVLRHTLESPAVEARRAGVLSDAELTRFNRLADPSQRVRRITARAGLRHILASHLGTQPANIAITTGEHAKPRVEGVAFNCSHARSLSLVAIAGEELGVDVEPVAAAVGIAAIRARFMNDADEALISATPAGEMPIAMLRLWVIKEACLKALGTGLTLDPRALRLRITSDSRVHITHNGVNLSVQVTERIPHHIAAVAARELDVLTIRELAADAF